MTAPTRAELTRAVNECFDEWTVSKGKTYFEQRRVFDIDLKLSSGEMTVRARVRGGDTEPYTTSVIVRRKRTRMTVDATCSCPVEEDCKHCVAVLLAAIDKQTVYRYEPAQKTLLPEPARVVPQPALPEPWVNWITDVKTAAKPAVEETDDYPPDEPRRVFYVVKPSSDGRGAAVEFYVAPVWGGDRRGPERLYLAQILSQTARFVRRIDKQLAQKLTIAQPYGSYEPKLNGSEGPELLKELLATERCKWQGAGQKHPVLKAGDKRSGKLSWRIDNKGQQFPTIDVSPKITTVIPLSPPWYVDENTAECGPIETGLPDAVAQAWLRAPAVLPEQSAVIEAQLKSDNLGALLPPPRKIETEIFDNLKPVPCLRLYSIDAVREFGHHYYDPRESESQTHLTLAHLEFAYRDTRVSSNFLPFVQHLVDGRFVRIVRDTKAEAQARDRLLRLQMLPASGHLFDYRLGKHKDDFAFAKWLAS